LGEVLLMEIINGLPPRGTGNYFIALGNFDGVHIGHKEIITAMVSEAKKLNGKSCVVTFRNHPSQLLKPHMPAKLLTPPSVKAKLISRLGVDLLVLLDFNRDLADLSPFDFVRSYIVGPFTPSLIYVGYNYSFGCKGSGNPDLLEELGKNFGYKVRVIPPVYIDERPVSSTYIRGLLEAGKIEEVKQCLGHWPVYMGEVVHGNALGRKLGYPTANLLITEEIQLPRPGVYFGKAEVGGNQYKGVANIGLRPTVNGNDLSFEVHLLGYQGNLYGRELTFHLKKRIRDEKKFSDVNELERQIARDIALAAHLKE
jgi:riboflavin kinase/FMN adenylyltransferase